MKYVDENGLIEIKNKIDEVKNSSSRTATYVIASYNSSDISKAGADYVLGEYECIAQAINKILKQHEEKYTGGLKIQLTEGEFNQISEESININKDCVAICGYGQSTCIKIVRQSKLLSNDYLFNVTADYDFFLNDICLATSYKNSSVGFVNIRTSSTHLTNVIFEALHIENNIINIGDSSSNVEPILNITITNCVFSNVSRINAKENSSVIKINPNVKYVTINSCNFDINYCNNIFDVYGKICKINNCNFKLKESSFLHCKGNASGSYLTLSDNHISLEKNKDSNTIISIEGHFNSISNCCFFVSTDESSEFYKYGDFINIDGDNNKLLNSEIFLKNVCLRSAVCVLYGNNNIIQNFYNIYTNSSPHCAIYGNQNRIDGWCVIPSSNDGETSTSLNLMGDSNTISNCSLYSTNSFDVMGKNNKVIFNNLTTESEDVPNLSESTINVGNIIIQKNNQ
ncbi:hypothetical protein KQI68_07410 [Peptoniphilus sp. MSJ-1]|uniref:Right handed beta helix domain-containing protein n=1 Tax=Peptoniphilus ovalis TaxID=2841503 RepID=A0ABS6FHL1_9FIRM|nr:hypothetical protein [Peptoniphilus ovalis]MBU5669667.1 hypothetical protein [Peptoniphilus ovalis]